MKCEEIINFMEEIAPLKLAEDWDNVGLLLGNSEQEINKIMVCLDVTDDVVNEAIKRKTDIIISHHPFIFKGLKKINENDLKGKNIYKLIKNNIGVYSAHTNLDSAEYGLTQHLAETLELKGINNLIDYKPEKLFKIVVFVPEESIDLVRAAMSDCGTGWIGKYSDCSFYSEGIGTFKPNKGSNPYIGTVGKLEKVKEYRIETIAPQNLIKKVIARIIEVHPYEEMAYDVYPLEISSHKYGYGKVGILENSIKLDDFIIKLKTALSINNVKMIGCNDNLIEKVAVFNGSLDVIILDKLSKDIDVLVTGDVKYHSAREIIDRGLFVIDAGHYGTEKIVVNMLSKRLSDRFPDLDIVCNSVEEDPFKIC